MALVTNFNIPSLDKMGGILHPKQLNRWVVRFVGIGGGAGSGNDVSAQATKCDRPSLSFDENELHRYNSRAYFGGKHKWETIAVTVEDDIGSRASTAISKQIEQQQKIIGSAAGEYLAAAASGSSYKFSMIISLLDGNDVVLEEWYLDGCWFQNIKWGSLDYSDSKAITIDLTVRYDHARQSLLPTSIKNPLATTAGTNNISQTGKV